MPGKVSGLRGALLQEVKQASLTQVEGSRREGATEAFGRKPHAVSSQNISLAVCGHLSDAPAPVTLIHARPIHPSGFSRKSHRATEFVQPNLAARGVGSEYVTQIKAIICVAVEVGPAREGRRCNAVDTLCNEGQGDRSWRR